MKNCTIVLLPATERGDRGECHVIFPSVTFQNPEEGEKKPLSGLNKKIEIILSIF